MAFRRAFIFLSLFFFCSNVWLLSATKDVLRGLEANITTKDSLWAPYYRNISAGGAWMIPTSAYDLEPRASECQCFNPNGTDLHRSLVPTGEFRAQQLMNETETCCMPKSSYINPFCVPKDSICCTDTFCEHGEICCGDSCCPSVRFSSGDHDSKTCIELTISLGDHLHGESFRPWLLSQRSNLLRTRDML